MKAIADILHDSRVYMERHGWTRHTARDRHTGKVCILGAVTWSQNWQEDSEEDLRGDNKNLPNLIEVATVLCNALGIKPLPVKGNRLAQVASWNDGSAENEQEVLDLLAKAEKIERAGFDPDA